MSGASKSQPRRSQAQLTTQFTTVIGMSLTLFLMGMLGLAALLGQWANAQMKQHVHVQVYLQRDMSPSQIDEARLAIAADPSVAASPPTSTLTEAAEELEAELGESFVSFLGYVPLPPVIDLVMRPDHVSTGSHRRVPQPGLSPLPRRCRGLLARRPVEQHAGRHRPALARADGRRRPLPACGVGLAQQHDSTDGVCPSLPDPKHATGRCATSVGAQAICGAGVDAGRHFRASRLCRHPGTDDLVPGATRHNDPALDGADGWGICVDRQHLGGWIQQFRGQPLPEGRSVSSCIESSRRSRRIFDP